MLFLHNFYIIPPLLWLSTIAQESQQSASRGHVLAFYRIAPCLSLQCVYWNRGRPDFEDQSDGRTETIDSNIFKSSQSNALFSTPANQTPGRKQNLNLFVLMLATTVSAINCQIIKNFVTLLKILHFNGGKFIWLNVFNCELTAEKILLYGFSFCSCCLCVFLFIHSFPLS